MNVQAESVKRHFARIGAKVRVEEQTASARRNRAYDINVLSDKRRKEETFLLSYMKDRRVEFSIIDVQPAERHLLLLVKTEVEPGITEKHHYLCGHDERFWFTAAVPSVRRGINNVRTAKEALKPDDVLVSQQRHGVKEKKRNRRSNAGFKRQGEWFFLPVRDFFVNDLHILHNEPLRRGGGKPHMAEFAYRRGGSMVYVCARYPNGVSQKTFNKIINKQPSMRNAGWKTMLKDPEVYCSGKISHPDHATIVLKCWHRVLANTEQRAPWIEYMAFLD